MRIITGFESIINSVHEGSVITFTEYDLDRHERKHISFQVKDVVVQAVVKANQKLSREELERYYGDDLDEIDYLQLSEMNCPRIIVSLGVNQYNQIDIKVIVLNQDFFNSGLQELTVTNELNISEEPNYLQAQRGW